MLFRSVRDLVAHIEEHGSYAFSSEPKRLQERDVLRQSIASGDFNPAHCRREFAPHSKFKGLVSHGIGILARGEAAFVSHMAGLFETPAEVIALGSKGFDYKKPLRVGDVYRYRLEVSNPRQVKDRWDFDCHIVCEVVKPYSRMVAEYHWLPSLVDHPEVSAKTLAYLRFKSYRQNIYEIFVPRPIRLAVCALPVLLLLGLMSLPLLAAAGLIRDPAQEQFDYCQAHPTFENCVVFGPM